MNWSWLPVRQAMPAVALACFAPAIPDKVSIEPNTFAALKDENIMTKMRFGVLKSALKF